MGLFDSSPALADTSNYDGNANPDFSPGVNYDFVRNSADSTTDIVSTITGGATATLVDAAASIWNSLPGTTEVSTEDLLGRISDNALNVYREHPDAIQAASFVGSSFIPMGLAFKGMNAMRAGSKAVNWFTAAGKAEDTARVANLLANGAKDTTEYRSAIRGLYAKTAVNQSIDMVAAELATVAMLHNTPLMEDYLKDPVTNFGISVALGGVIGSGVGIAAEHFAVKSAAGKLSSEAFDFLKKDMLPLPPSATHGAAIQVLSKNSELLDNIVRNGAVLGKTPENDLIVSMASKTKTLYDNEVEDIFQKIVPPALFDSLDSASKLQLKQLVVNSPEMLGVESVARVSQKDATSLSLMQAPKSALEESPTFITTASKYGPTLPKSVPVAYFPDTKLYGMLSDIKHYGGAASLNSSMENLAKGVSRNFGKNGNFDTGLELGVKSAPQLQGDLIGTIAHVDSLSLASYKNVKVAATDTSMLEGMIAKALVDPAYAEAGIRIAKANTYNAAVAAENLITPDTYKFLEPAAISKFYPWIDSMGALDTGVQKTITNWINSGGMHDFRKGAVEYLQDKFATYKASKTNTPDEVLAHNKILAQNFANVYESAGSKAARAEAAKIADKDGNILLWRGSESTADATSVRSYTTEASGAKEHGTPRLYKVKVDDIIAVFKDVASVGNKPEILVLEGRRNPIKLSAAGKNKLVDSLDGTTTISIEAAQKQVLTNKQAEIDALLQTGIPYQSIAIKTNTPVDLITEYMLTRNFKEASDNFLKANPGKNLSTINSVESAQAALAFKNAPLVLHGNPKKYSYTTAIANNDSKMLGEMHSNIVASELYRTQNPFIMEFADKLLTPSSQGGSREMLDLLFARTSKANNELAGNFFTQSADFAMRNMADMGPIVSYIGKAIQGISNRLNDSIKTPIAEAMNAISKTSAEVVEFNTFREVAAGLKGWRIVVDGKIMQRVLDDAGVALRNLDGTYALKAATFQGKEYQIVSPSVLKTIEKMQEQSKVLLDITNASRRIQGMPDVADLGLWMPSFNPVDKFISYVHDISTDTTSLIWANTKEESAQLVKSYRESIAAQGKSDTVHVYEKGAEQKQWSTMNGRLDTMNMTIADSSAMKAGASGGALIRTDTQVFHELLGGYEHYINAQMRKLADLTMYDTMHELDMMSKLNRYSFDNQPLTAVKRIASAPRDAAANMKNLLLGDSNLGNYEGWKSANTSFETGLSMASNIVSKVWDSATLPLRKTFLGGKKELTTDSMQKMNYETFAKELESKGIVNPWSAFDKEAARMFGLSKLEDSPDTSKRIIFASNSLAATAALRFGELAQPLVNMMSLPVLSSLAIANKMPETFLGVSKGTTKVPPVQIMYEGIRAMNDPTFAHFGKMWEQQGYFTPFVSEVNATLGTARSFDRGMIQSIEQGLDSSFVKMMSKPADYAESLSRKVTMYTGMVLAKRLYPELDDLGVTIFARDFMDKAVGNFHAAQRPVFFQGTLGVALGLFQTYSLTLGQNIYRHLELKNYKALGVAALTQSGIFGAGSMPGFGAVSNMIGNHFSDNNVDLVTGTYRAVGDSTAQSILYGLPSLAGIGTNTRGDANFRIPGLTGDNIVALNFAKQAATSIGQIAGSLGQGNNVGQAFMEALSLQSMSRPIARGAELASGYSITKAGNTVQTPAEVWTTTGIMARVLSTRPIAEIKLREADQLNRYYGAADRDNRNAVVNKLQTAIRNDTFSDMDFSKAAETYFRHGGSPTGWKAAINTIQHTTDTSGREIFAEKLKPNNPLNFMISNL